MTGKDINWSLVPSGYPPCQVVDLTKRFNFKKQTPMFLIFKFFLHKNLGISLQIEDQRSSLIKRGLRTQRHDYVGPALAIGQLSTGAYQRYHLKISQTINLEMDSGIRCRNYPNKEFQSYRNCDENFVYKKMKNKYKAMPFWAATTLEEVTNRTCVFIM